MEASADAVRLTIEPESEPIAGSIDLPDGRTLRFEGYVQLVAALEDVRVSPPSDNNDPGGRA